MKKQPDTYIEFLPWRKSADQYGFVIRPAELYEPLNYTTIQVNSSIADLAAFAKEQGISYKLLKWYNPWLRENYLRVAQGVTYDIKVPA